MILNLNDETSDDRFDPSVVGCKGVGLFGAKMLGLNVPEGVVLAAGTVRNYASGWRPDKNSIYAVRSSGPVSMPGILDTICNLGFTRDTYSDIAKDLGVSELFGLDCYRRLMQSYGTSVLHIEREAFAVYSKAVKDFFVDPLQDRPLRLLVEKYERLIEKESGRILSSNVNHMINESVLAVEQSWWSDTARYYREVNDIDDSPGMAVIIQEMVFGNLNDKSATGVVFTHDPTTGVRGLFGEVVLGGQGDDVVAGDGEVAQLQVLLQDPTFTDAVRDLKIASGKLFLSQTEMLDIEFTIENQKLWILQSRVAKRSKRASVRLALDLARSGAITAEQATNRILEFIPAYADATTRMDGSSPLGIGVPCGGGSVAAPIAIGTTEANKQIKSNNRFIFVAPTTTTTNHIQMAKSVGILTGAGGSLSHAAILARSWDKPCVVGFSDMRVFDDYILVDETKVVNGETLLINGDTGLVSVCNDTKEIR